MTKFILSSRPKRLDNIDFDYLKNIEMKIYDDVSLKETELNYFLDFLVYITRDRLDNDFENASFKNLCNRAQCMIHYYLEDLGVEHYLNRSFLSISPDVVDHSFLVAIFNVENVSLPYLIDPTFRQFFEFERCQKRYLTPGNFIRNQDKNLISNFLVNGYMLLNGENAFVYGNSIYFTSDKLPKEKIPISGEVFIKAFLKENSVISKTREDLINEGLYIKPLISVSTKSYK